MGCQATLGLSEYGGDFQTTVGPLGKKKGQRGRFYKLQATSGFRRSFRQMNKCRSFWNASAVVKSVHFDSEAVQGTSAESDGPLTLCPPVHNLPEHAHIGALAS